MAQACASWLSGEVPQQSARGSGSPNSSIGRGIPAAAAPASPCSHCRDKEWGSCGGILGRSFEQDQCRSATALRFSRRMEAPDMFKHCLIATDGSELAQKAVVQGLALAKQLNAKVLAVMVTEPWTMIPGKLPTPSVVKAYKKANAENANRITSQVVDAAQAQGRRVFGIARERQAPGSGHRRGCQQERMRSHHHGVPWSGWAWATASWQRRCGSSHVKQD